MKRDTDKGERGRDSRGKKERRGEKKEREKERP